MCSHICILPEVLGVHTLAAAYGSTTPDGPAATAHEDDPLGLDAALDKAFAPTADAPVDADPLGLDLAFDNLFSAGKVTGADSSTEQSEVGKQCGIR